jgi:predicted nucleic acid-binding Zn ribbon protein
MSSETMDLVNNRGLNLMLNFLLIVIMLLLMLVLVKLM